MKKSMFAVLLLIATSAMAADSPATFESMTEAATYALKVSYDQSPYYEYGGVIQRTSAGKFTASFPHTDYSGDSVAIDQDYAAYVSGAPIVATYHTHPCLSDSHVPDVFSYGDVHWARYNMRPAYMADLCTGKVHFFDPVADRENSTLFLKAKIAVGQIVGEFPVSGKVIEKISSSSYSIAGTTPPKNGE